MAQLAIKGHRTRGSEIIELLDMLGGKNTFGLSGDASDLYYFIDNNNKISYTYTSSTLYKFTDFKIFTVDEFYKKQKTMEIKPNIIKNKNAFIDIANAEYSDVNTIELLCSDMFDIEIIHEDKIVLKRKKPQYPKTYVECCEILYPNENFQLIALPFKGHNYKQLFALQKLLACRDTYWKIAGEQMKLGKSWEPNWNSGDQERYGIIKLDDNGYQYAESTSFVFPTEEMRDAFYENFKKLIEACKELL